jgi:hypothetical protein
LVSWFVPDKVPRYRRRADRFSVNINSVKVFLRISKADKMREISTDRPAEELQFSNAAEAKEALEALSRTLREKSSEMAIKEEPTVKTEPQGSLLKAVLDGSSGSSSNALKDSFEARSMKSEEGGTGNSGGRPVYSLADTAGPLYLKRIQSLAEAKKTQRIVKVCYFEKFCLEISLDIAVETRGLKWLFICNRASSTIP